MIEISIFVYDILRVLKLLDVGIRKVVVVGFLNIIENLLFLKEVLLYKIDVFIINFVD